MNIQELFFLSMKRVVPDLLDMPKYKGAVVLNIGTGNWNIPDTTPLDLPDWDADDENIPYGDGEVAGIHAYHFLEHCYNPIDILYEFQRVLEPDGLVNIVVPYYTSQMQAQDLTHQQAFCEETWKNLFSNSYYKTPYKWEFRVHACFIMGIVERNIALFTQLVRTGELLGDQIEF